MSKYVLGLAAFLFMGPQVTFQNAHQIRHEAPLLVPATTLLSPDGTLIYSTAQGGWVAHYPSSCDDPTRILLTAENGNKFCLLSQPLTDVSVVWYEPEKPIFNFGVTTTTTPAITFTNQ